MPPTRPRKFGRGSCGILGTTCTSLPRTVPGSTRWSAGSPYCHNARSNEVRTTACVNWNLPSWSSSRCTTSSPNPLCGPRVPMPFSTALDGSLPVLWPHTAQTICKKSVTQETSLWVVQQLRESFPFELAPRFLIFDRDAKYGLEVPVAVRSLKMSPVRTSFESPWQNGVAERWVESSRRDLLDHVIAVNERHLKRLLSEYVRYYHEDRTHLGLRKGTPDYRIRSTASGRFLSQDRLGGLHHRYVRAA